MEQTPFTRETPDNDHCTKRFSLALQQWPGRAVGASQSDSVGSTQLCLGGALARSVLSKSTPEETIKQIQVEHFVEQLAWIHQRIQCQEDQRGLVRDDRDMTSKYNGSSVRS